MHSKQGQELTTDSVRALVWEQSYLAVLDQRVLPGEVCYNRCSTAEDVAEAIRSMQVRGAPAIGIAAAYGVVLAARAHFESSSDQWKQHIVADLERLAQSRPTAVNLFWALNEMQVAIDQCGGNPAQALLSVAQRIHRRDIAGNREMGRLGAGLLTDCNGILTHCNTGSLATGGYGTALGVVRSAVSERPREVFATETRPWLQGARLTVWELLQERIPATLIADSAAASLMKSGRVQWVIVGADRIAANGDVANKIGTYSLAVLARHHGVRFMVAAPTSTIDRECETGDGIRIEYRDHNEVLPEYYRGEDSCIGAWNPVFDVTPAELVDAIVTENGVVTAPDRSGIDKLF